MAQTVDPDVGDSRSPVTTPTELEKLYRALVAGDLAAAQALCSEDVVLHVPGRSQIAGSYRGPEGVVSYFRSLGELSNGTATTTVDNVAVTTNKAVITQKVTADRSNKELKDQQNVLLRIEAERVVEGFVYPFDLRVHDAFWGRTPLFTPEDRDLIAEAIRRGSAPPPDPNAKRRVIMWFALATAVFLVTLLSFNYLNSNYSAQKLLATTTDLSSVRHIVVSHRDNNGAWRVQPALVERVSVVNAIGEVRIGLPVPGSDCELVASRLGSVCDGRTITVAPPYDLAWSDPARLIGDVSEASRLDLELTQATEEGGGVNMTLVTSSIASPTLCFSQPPARNGLRLIDAEGVPTRLPIQAGGAVLSCDEGIVLRVRDAGLGRIAGSRTQSTSLELAGMSMLELDARGTFSDLDSLAGKLALINVENRIFDSAARVISNSDSTDPIETSIDIGETGTRLAMRSEKVSSVVIDEGEILPTQWERLPQPLVALFGSLVTALVLPALIAFLQLARDRVLLGRKRPA